MSQVARGLGRYTASMGRTLVLALLLGLVGCDRTPQPQGKAPVAATDPRYVAKGVIKTLAPDLSYASIAHEDIPGYMKAMTMDFEAGSKDQLKGFAVGDSVQLVFAETKDARLVIDKITKR